MLRDKLALDIDMTEAGLEGLAVLLEGDVFAYGIAIYRPTFCIGVQVRAFANIRREHFLKLHILILVCTTVFVFWCCAVTCRLYNCHPNH